MKINLSILIVLTLLVLVSLACGSSTAAPEPQKIGEATPIVPVADKPAAPPEVKTYKVGDMVQVGDLVVVVNGLEFSNGDDIWKPDAGKRFAIVDVTFENRGSSSKSISGLLQITLKDDTGMEYNEDMAADIVAGNSTPSGEIVPGDKLRGKIGFQVPGEAKGFRFVFDASLFSSGKVFVELGQ